MASTKIKRDFPSLAAYLDHPHPNPLFRRIGAGPALGCLMALVSSLVVGVGVFALASPAIGPLMAVVASLAGSGAAAFAVAAAGWRIGRKNAAAPTAEDQLLAQGFGAVESFRRLDNEKRIPKWVDPIALQLLEAGAYHWGRVRQTFAGSQWHSADLPEHRANLRDKAIRAADLAMAELAILSAQCVGEPKKNRKDDFQAAFEDFADLAIEDAIRGLARVAATHPKAYRFESPRAKEIFEPAKGLAEQLKGLADEVAGASFEAPAEDDGLRTSLGRESIDSLLTELRYTRLAEEELHGQQPE